MLLTTFQQFFFSFFHVDRLFFFFSKKKKPCLPTVFKKNNNLIVKLHVTRLQSHYLVQNTATLALGTTTSQVALLYTLDCADFCPQNCLNSLCHSFNKVLESFPRDFGPYSMIVLCSCSRFVGCTLFEPLRWLQCVHKGMDMVRSKKCILWYKVALRVPRKYLPHHYTTITSLNHW